MNIVFDATGEAERATNSLRERGIRPLEVVRRTELKPGTLLSTLRRLRKVKPEACYIFCRQLQTQFNRFPLKVVAVMCGAKNVFFCDERAMGPLERPALILCRDLPLYLWHCIYGLFAILGFCVIALLARILVWMRRTSEIKSTPGILCYIKTDYWHDLKAGGSVTHTREFINSGCRLGYRFKVFSCDPLAHYKLIPDVEVIHPAKGLYDLPIFVSQMEYNLRFPLAVRRRMGCLRVGGIYQRNSTNNFSGVLLSALLRAPFVLEFNTSLAWAAKNWSGARTASLPGFCERLNLAGASRIAVVSKTLKDRLRAEGLPESKILVNPNGVDPVRFGPRVDSSAVRNTLPKGKLLIGFIGVFGQWHGVTTLMRSVKHVVRRYEEAHFVIIGDGALKVEMAGILERDGVAEHVTFVGLIPHDSAPAYLNACEVLVSPHENMADGSVFFGSPTKIFEYMAAGKGIVASRVGQLGEMLKHERDALLVAERDELQLAEAIIRLLQDPELRERLGEAARQKVLAQYTWNQNFLRVAASFNCEMRAADLLPPTGLEEASRNSEALV